MQNTGVATQEQNTSVSERLAFDLSSLDVQSIAIISGGDEIASLTVGHAITDMAASCCCNSSSCCSCAL
jgi:hypothetical protein